MAVCLLREGERRSTQPQSPETRRLPRVTVLNRPVVAAPHWRGALRARTPTHVSYTQPEREEVWKESFQRRKVQQSECGFHGPAHQPYKDVGHVELDDPTLILDGLGQKQDKQLSGPRSPSPAAATPTHISPPPLPPPPPSRPPLRSMAPQLPDDLSLLPEEMKEGEGRRGEVKVGRSLSESVSARETAKQEASSGKETKSRAQTTDWHPPDVTFDPTVLGQ
ncbi:hypothetical protein GBAR_LOCUS25743 [Geodia barretti]|uniref:Uncharacterized protein n=1 Tax=Geodia barretti TaxID=519541 RepID=A0AA35TEI8_GEOBA|nr:hypothetical protein GBAR_LOCUS25743 [Geodia barretti]